MATRSEYVRRKRREHAKQFANGRPSWVRAEWDIRGIQKTPAPRSFHMPGRELIGPDYVLAQLRQYLDVMERDRPGWRRVVALPAKFSEHDRWRAMVIAARYDVEIEYVGEDK